MIEAVAHHLHPHPVAGFGGKLVGVAHVASRLADEASPSYLEGVPETPIDHDYLIADGSADSLEDWRYVAEQVADGVV